ncbi:MAG: GumC family protein, partial [Vicinamibacteria bacterium]
KELARWARTKLEELLIAVNLKEELTEREKILLGLQESLAVDRRKDSDVISVRLRLPDPGLAVEFVDTLLRLYINRHIEVRRDSANTGFFEYQAADYKQQLTTIEMRRAALRREFDLTSIEEERDLLLRRLHDLYDEIADDETERALILQSGYTDALSEDEASTDAPLESNLTVPLMKDRVTQLRINRVSLAAKYQSDSRVILETEREIARLESMLIGALSGRIGERRAQASEIERRLQTLSASEDLLDSVERERMLAEQNYMSYAKRVEESRISSELDDRRVANVAILASPSLPIEPVAPRKLLVMALSIPAGILLGVGLALFLDYLSDRVREPSDLDGIPYLGTFRISS